MWAKVFANVVFEFKSLRQTSLRLKWNFQQKKGSWFLLHLFDLFLDWKDKQSKNGKVNKNCFFSTVWDILLVI